MGRMTLSVNRTKKNMNLDIKKKNHLVVTLGKMTIARTQSRPLFLDDHHKRFVEFSLSFISTRYSEMEPIFLPYW